MNFLEKIVNFLRQFRKTSPSLELTVNQQVNQMMEKYSSNTKLYQIETVCREILKTEPLHANVLYLLGIIAEQNGYFNEAKQLMSKAIAIAPSVESGQKNKVDLEVAKKHQLVVGKILEISLQNDLQEELYGYSIGNPTKGELVDANNVKIWGWVLGRVSSVIAIEITDETSVHPNNLILKTVPINVPRPDIAKIFPHVLGASKTGFLTNINLLLLPIQVSLGITAVFADQSRVRLAEILLYRCPLPLPPKSQPKTKPKIAFIHIPKTAGTSLRQIVAKEYLPKECLYLYEDLLANFKKPYIFQAIKVNLSLAKILYGHFYFGIHESLEVPSVYICVLRNPIKRVISYYNHIAHNPSEVAIYKKIQGGMSLLEMLQNQVSAQTDNLMTRMLAGKMNASFKDQQILEVAIENIHKYFYFIGLTENFSDSVNVLGKKLGWKQHEIPYSNVNSNKIVQEIDSKTRSAIEEHNHLDILLYEYISNLDGGYFLNDKFEQLFE